jgi:uncharacterized protein (DUF58 family)
VLTRAGFMLLFTGTILFVIGLPTGNLILLALSMLPLSVLITAAITSSPTRIHVNLLVPQRSIRIGETIPLTIEYQIHGGRGVVEIHQGLPDIFMLESGNNLHVVAKTHRTISGRHTFTVRVPRRGRFHLPPVQWEHTGALGFTRTRTGTAGSGATIDVRPTLRIVRRIPNQRGRAAIPLTAEDPAVAGIQSTEFREIREYHRGDPVRAINWKATARLDARRRSRLVPQHEGGHPAPPHRLTPLVNEYEREGRRNTWIYLDCGPHMRIGTSAMNAFECAVSATIGVAGHLIEHGHRVGLTLYNRIDPRHLYPDTGRRQIYMLQSTLAEAETTTHTGGLPLAVAETRRYLLSGRTRVIVVTRAESDHDGLKEGLRLIEKYTATRRDRPRILVASPDAYALIPKNQEGTDAARRVINQQQRARHEEIRRIGAQLLVWDPTTTQFEEVIARRASVR